MLKEKMLCYDVIFKTIFVNNLNILARMISDITNLDYNLLKDNIMLDTNELPVANKNNKFKKCDFIIKIKDNMIINLEINKNTYSGLLIKNLSYVFNIFSNTFKKGEKYNDDLIIFQININAFHENNAKALSRNYLSDIDDYNVYTDSIAIYNLSIDKCHELFYNYDNLNIPKYILWGELLYQSDCSKIEELSRLLLSKEESEKLMRKISELSSEEIFMSNEERLEWEEWEKNTIYDDGVKEGIEQEKISNIKKMLENNIDIEIISKITGLSVEEIKNI